jgi:hypothetical protein
MVSKTCRQNVKVFKQIYTSIYMFYKQTWLDILVDVFKEHHKFFNFKNSLMQLSLSLSLMTNYNSFIYFLTKKN